MSRATSSSGAQTPKRPHSSFGLSAPTRRDASTGLRRVRDAWRVLVGLSVAKWERQPRTVTVTRWTALLAYPPTFHPGSSGCVAPVESVARQHRTPAPGDALHSIDP